MEETRLRKTQQERNPILVLSRTPNEIVVLDITKPCRIEVTVTSVRGKCVGLGFDAPLYVKINRKEIQALIDRGEGYEG